MNVELIKIVSDLKTLFDDWTARVIPLEKEFVDKLKILNASLTEELKKPQEKTIQEK